MEGIIGEAGIPLPKRLLLPTKVVFSVEKDNPLQEEIVGKENSLTRIQSRCVRLQVILRTRLIRIKLTALTFV